MTKVSSKYQGVEGAYYIVNPFGAVHSVARDHATFRLRSAGYRLATDDEIEQFKEQRTQRFDRPIAERWSPEIDIVEAVPDEKIDELPEATEKAVALAKEHGLDLAAVNGSGASGRILVKDVEAALAESEQ